MLSPFTVVAVVVVVVAVVVVVVVLVVVVVVVIVVVVVVAAVAPLVPLSLSNPAPDIDRGTATLARRFCAGTQPGSRLASLAAECSKD